MVCPRGPVAQGPPVAGPSRRAEPLALTALVVAVVSVPLFFAVVPAVLGLALALVAGARIRRSPEARGGLGMAVAAIVVAGATLVGGVAFDALVASSPNHSINAPLTGLGAATFPAQTVSNVGEPGTVPLSGA